MEDDLTPQDDNLRLIFSEGHAAWLDDKVTRTKRAIVVLFVIVALGAAGGVGAANFLSGWWASAPQCGYLTPQEIVAQSNGEGVTAAEPCSSGDDGLMPPLLPAGFIILSAIITLVAAVELFRQLSQLKKYRSFTHDHREFLSKYNRL